jgi:hypothetical protein
MSFFAEPALTVKSPTDSFELSRQQAVHLELALNNSEKTRTWQHIGDALYKFAADPTVKLNVTEEQFRFLKDFVVLRKERASKQRAQ